MLCTAFFLFCTPCPAIECPTVFPNKNKHVHYTSVVCTIKFLLFFKCIMHYFFTLNQPHLKNGDNILQRATGNTHVDSNSQYHMNVELGCQSPKCNTSKKHYSQLSAENECDKSYFQNITTVVQSNTNASMLFSFVHIPMLMHFYQYVNHFYHKDHLKNTTILFGFSKEAQYHQKISLNMSDHFARMKCQFIFKCKPCIKI